MSNQSWQERAKILEELSAQMNAARRFSPPDEADEANWEAVGDMDTGKLSWVPRALFDQYQAVRWAHLCS